MGHLVKIYKNGIKDLINSGLCSIKANLGNHWYKTAADCFADSLCVRKGDLIFLWIIADPNTGDSNEGFQYIFTVKDGPFLMKGDPAPIKIQLNDNGWKYKIHLPEEDALDLFSKKLLWNMIGFKSAKRGKAITHQTLEEDNLLMQKLENIPSQLKKEIRLYSTPCNKKLQRITTNNLSNYTNEENERMLRIKNEQERLANLNLSKFPFVKGKRFSVEKCLEAWFMENLTNGEIKDIFFGKESKLKWFANYIFYGVQGSNIDVVVDYLIEKKRFINVIELKVSSLSDTDLKDAIKQIDNYEIFLKNAYKTFMIEKLNTTKTLICFNLRKSAKENSNLIKKIKDKSINVFFYEIDEGKVKIKKFL